jgi:hypothetical protein
MHEVTVRATPARLLVALGAACMKLMRIIPDNEPGYSDSLVTVKRYLLDGAASAFCAVVFRALLPFSPPNPNPLPEGEDIGSGLAS